MKSVMATTHGPRRRPTSSATSSKRSVKCSWCSTARRPIRCRSRRSAISLSLPSLCQPYHSILCQEIAHVEVSECGAPEFFANGTKVLLPPGENGKIEPAAIERAVTRRTDIHYPKPRALTLTQATEVGTVYTPDELKALWG